MQTAVSRYKINMCPHLKWEKNFAQPLVLPSFNYFLSGVLAKQRTYNCIIIIILKY